MRCRQGLFRCGIVGNACCVRATHLSTRVLLFVRHLTDADRLDRVRGYVCRKKRWGAEQTQMLRRGSEQTEPAGFSGPGREGRMVQSRRVSAIVILKSSPLSLSPFPPLWTFYWWLITSVDFRSGTRFYLKIFFFFLQNFFPPSNQLYIYQSNRCVLIQRGGRFKILYIYIFLRTLIRNIFYPRVGMLDHQPQA